MSEIERYEILVLGSGEAGKHLTWAMAQAGHRTAVVERKYIGGSCPNIACLPSKNIIRSAKAHWFAQHGAEYGIQGKPRTDMIAVQKRKRDMVEREVQGHLDRFKASGASLIRGEGRFVADRTIEVRLNEGGTRLISGERVFLDLGSRAAIPDIPGLSAARPMTHVEALNLDRVPRHVIVLGGGYVGLELAQALRRFGSAVTIIERGRQVAAAEDPDVSQVILDNLRSEGIDVLFDARMSAVEGVSGHSVRVTFEDGQGGKKALEGSDLLVAAGRTPNTQGIGLEAVGIELEGRGYIKVNERLETTAANVWAMGDCAGSLQFTHVAFDDFRVIRDNLNGGNRTTRDRLIPFCMFTDPELARVGLNESEAKKRGIAYRVATMPMAAVLRAVTLGETRGFLKVLIDAQSDRILGFTALGIEASEMVAAMQTAMLGGMPYIALRDAIFTHPTTAEGLVFLLANVPALRLQQAS